MNCFSGGCSLFSLPAGKTNAGTAKAYVYRRSRQKGNAMTTITNIKEFVKAVKAVMESNLPDYEIAEQDVVKMNDIVNHGLYARRNSENAGATVYLDDAFRSGEDINSVADTLTNIVLEAEKYKPVTAESDFDFSFEAIKDMLTLRLVDTEKNEVYLAEHPHRNIGAGLAVVAEINVGNDYSIVVSNSIAKEYDIEVLFDTAEENMRTLYPAKMISLTDAIFGEGRNILDSDDENIEGLYTLMIGEMHNFGASTLAYKGVAERIRNLFGSAYYILPSSLHEVIILKDDGTANVADLKEMVEQANNTVVAPSDVLSDSVFHYGADGLRRVA